MPTTVGNHSVAQFVNPSNGSPLDAEVVKGNDNTLRTAYVNHDADPGVHLQSSVLASRPAAGVAGRKWMTTDGGVKIWYDTGSVWEDITVSAIDAASITSGTLPDARFPATLPVANGSNLTNLNASNLSSGTVPDARFPATLPVLNGSNLTNVAAAAGSLTGTTLASNVVTSSLTSVGTLGSLTVTGAITANGAVSIAGTTTLQQALEKVTVSATAATGTINYDALTQAVLYYTSDATGNWTLNVRGSSGTALSSVMSAGQVLTVVFLVTNGGTAYYPTAHQIDGSSVTPKWLQNAPVTAGNINAIDVYTYTIVRSGAGFTMFASRTFFV
jgi:hypothetical protein